MQKKIIIAYASAGAGHQTAAEALYSTCKEAHPDYDVRLVDALAYVSPFYRFLYVRCYTALVHDARFLWGILFWLARAPFVRSFSYFFDARNASRVTRIFQSEHPDVIISTHFLTSHLAARLKCVGAISARVVTVITDFGVHPFWVARATDTYIVASDFTRGELLRLGVQAQAILTLGIPIHAKFLKQLQKDVSRKKLGLRNDIFTVLIATGSFGIGPIQEIVACMHTTVQLIVVCARNTRLYTALKAKNFPGVSVLGYVNNIEELMSASDLIITKPGGLTIAELLAMELPPIFISYIPGQESANLSFLEQRGIGIQASTLREIRDCIMAYYNDPAKIASVKEKMRLLKMPQAAERICDAVC